MKAHPWPPLCRYHRILYRAKAKKRRLQVRHPGEGRGALVEEAQHISDACCRKALGLPPRWRP